MQLIDLEYLRGNGIEKRVFGHDFVYRFPESEQMPRLNPPELALDLGKTGQSKLAFYFHIPFCTKFCNFCHYYKEALPSGKIVEKYLIALKKELAVYRKLITSRVKVQSIFLGGGTPTLLKGEQLNDLLESFAGIFPFGRRTEVSIESSPETLSQEKLFALREAGFNRLSIGSQDFDENVLRASNRAHSPRQAEKAVENARSAGFENINMDLIYGLPRQSAKSWERTMQIARGIELESITASDLRVQRNTAFFSWKREQFPSVEEMRKMYHCFIETFLRGGYLQQFPYQFVKRGKEMQFLENQWNSGKFIGIGASSCSFASGWDYNNTFPLHRYLHAIEERGIAAALGKRLSREEEMKRFVALGLKKSGLNRENSGVGKKEFIDKFGVGINEMFEGVIEKLKEIGLIEENKNRIELSYNGLFFHDEVAREFMQK